MAKVLPMDGIRGKARIALDDLVSIALRQNRNAIGITVARGRVYAGCGDRGVLIYDAARFRRTGQIGSYVDEYVVNHVDKIGEDILFFTNYWYPNTKEGVWLFDLRRNPDSSRLIGNSPDNLARGTAGFRALP